MRFLDKGSSERGLDTIMGLIRGAGHAGSVIELFLEYIGARWDGTVLFRRDGELLVPWLGIDVLHPRALDELTLPVHDGSALAHLAVRPAMMLGPLSGTETEQLVARLLIGNPYCMALAMSLPISVDVRYVLFACRDVSLGPADKSEYQMLLREISEKLTRLEARQTSGRRAA